MTPPGSIQHTTKDAGVPPMSEQETALASLRDTLNAWVKAVSTALAGHDVPGMYDFVATTTGGNTSGAVELRPDYYALAAGNRGVLRELSETDDVLEVA